MKANIQYSSKKVVHPRFNFRFLLIFLFSTAVLILFDQWTKIAAANALKGKSAFVLIDGVFEFSYLENSGMAWGMFAGARSFFLVITIIIGLAIIWLVAKMPYKKRYIPLLLTAVLLEAGALGNFIDRLMLGYVRDFLYFRLIHFPVFNVADSYVTVGMILFAILVLLIYRENEFDFLKRR